MTKYLINLVCIIGVAGAAHAGAVANLEITADGHAYIVFANTGNGELSGYTIEDTAVAPTISFERPGAGEDGTGQFATAWSSLDSQGAFAGEQAGTHDWFFEGDPVITSFLGEGNIDGYLSRANGAPVYIGRIIDTDAVGFGGALVPADFAGGGRLENIEFSVSDSADVVETGGVSLRTATALTAGTTALAGTPYQETGAIGAAGTHIDATYVENPDGTGDVALVDLEVGAVGTTVGNVTTTVFGAADGHVMVNGNVIPITYADLVEETDSGSTGAFVSAHLRVQAVSGGTTIAIDADLTETGTDALGRYGTLGSTLVISTVPGDFDLDGDCDAADIDGISGLLTGPTPAASMSLLYDVDQDGDVDGDDRLEVITALVEWSNADPNSGNGTAIGDISLDGKVTAADYTLWASNFGPGTGWGTGDLNGDGQNTAADYTLWASNFGTGPGEPAPAPLAPVAAPEPATMALLAMGGLALVRRRRRS
ncbi:MAG: PEP-CTERM sorting domain-containing protein [Phycisphaerae bacterium]|jgi:hypothetical protein|nr:PEP-CTERM sorting domain-containing protein [Phycisphaerae bacterium]